MSWRTGVARWLRLVGPLCGMTWFSCRVFCFRPFSVYHTGHCRTSMHLSLCVCSLALSGRCNHESCTPVWVMFPLLLLWFCFLTVLQLLMCLATFLAMAFSPSVSFLSTLMAIVIDFGTVTSGCLALVCCCDTLSCWRALSGMCHGSVVGLPTVFVWTFCSPWLMHRLSLQWGKSSSFWIGNFQNWKFSRVSEAFLPNAWLVLFFQSFWNFWKSFPVGVLG